MKNMTISKRYAKALYQVATETHVVDDVLLGLNNLHHAMQTAPELESALFNPLVKPEEKQAVVKAITSNKLILKFILMLAKRKRLELIHTIRHEFQVHADVDKGISRVLVKSAADLTDDQKKNIEKELSKKLGGMVIGKFEVAKELIGGIWIKLGDKVLDASVRGRFDDLKHHLIHSTN